MIVYVLRIWALLGDWNLMWSLSAHMMCCNLYLNVQNISVFSFESRGLSTIILSLINSPIGITDAVSWEFCWWNLNINYNLLTSYNILTNKSYGLRVIKSTIWGISNIHYLFQTNNDNLMEKRSFCHSWYVGCRKLMNIWLLRLDIFTICLHM